MRQAATSGDRPIADVMRKLYYGAYGPSPRIGEQVMVTNLTTGERRKMWITEINHFRREYMAQAVIAEQGRLL